MLPKLDCFQSCFHANRNQAEIEEQGIMLQPTQRDNTEPPIEQIAHDPKSSFLLKFDLQQHGSRISNRDNNSDISPFKSALTFLAMSDQDELKRELMPALIEGILTHESSMSSIDYMCNEITKLLKCTGLYGFNPEFGVIVHQVVNPDLLRKITIPLTQTGTHSAGKMPMSLTPAICAHYHYFPNPDSLTFLHRNNLASGTMQTLLREHNPSFQSSIYEQAYQKQSFLAASAPKDYDKFKGFDWILAPEEFFQQAPGECSDWPKQLLVDWASGKPQKELIKEKNNQKALALFNSRIEALKSSQITIPKIEEPVHSRTPLIDTHYCPHEHGITKREAVPTELTESSTATTTTSPKPDSTCNNTEEIIKNLTNTNTENQRLNRKLAEELKKIETLESSLLESNNSKVLVELKVNQIAKELNETQLMNRNLSSQLAEELDKITKLEDSLSKTSTAKSLAEKKLQRFCNEVHQKGREIYDTNLKNGNACFKYARDVENLKINFNYPPLSNYYPPSSNMTLDDYPVCGRYINISLPGFDGSAAGLTSKTSPTPKLVQLSESAKQAACYAGFLEEQQRTQTLEFDSSWLACTATALLSLPSVMHAMDLFAGSDLDKVQATCLMATALFGTLSLLPPIGGASFTAAASLAAGASLGSLSNSLIQMARSALSEYSYKEVSTFPKPDEDLLSFFCRQQAKKDNRRDNVFQFATRVLPSLGFFCQHMLEAYSGKKDVGLSGDAQTALCIFSWASLFNVAGSFKHHLFNLQSVEATHPTLLSLAAYLEKQDLKQLTAMLKDVETCSLSSEIKFDLDQQLQFLQLVFSSHPEKDQLNEGIEYIYKGKNISNNDSSLILSTGSREFLQLLKQCVRSDRRSWSCGLTAGNVMSKIIIPLIQVSAMREEIGAFRNSPPPPVTQREEAIEDPGAGTSSQVEIHQDPHTSIMMA